MIANAMRLWKRDQRIKRIDPTELVSQAAEGSTVRPQ
jgi:hypothetical protein